MEIYNVLIGDVERQYADGTVLTQIAQDFQDEYDAQIVLALKDGKLTELFRSITGPCKLEFITTKTAPGIETYKRSATLIMMKAFYDVAGVENVEKIKVEYSISKGYYCTVEGNVEITKQLLEDVKTQKQKLVSEDIAINKRTISVDSAKALFNRHKMYDKEKLFRFRRASKVNIYSLNGFLNRSFGFC